MDSTGSFLYTMIERTRGYLDAEETDKYSNDYMVRNLVQPCMADVLSRLNHNADNPVLLRHSITLVQGTQFYQLPPCIQEVWRFMIINDQGVMMKESVPRDYFHPRGPGWEIQGNVLSVSPYPTGGVTMDLIYVSNGDVRCHYGTSTVAADLQTVTLGATPTLGEVERRPNAYAGQIFRTLPASGVREERVIESYNASTRVAVLRLPLAYASVGALTHEIAPMGLEALYEAIATRCAMKLGVYRNISQGKAAAIQQEYLIALKTIQDNLSNFQMRTGKSYHKGTVDNPGWYRM